MPPDVLDEDELELLLDEEVLELEELELLLLELLELLLELEELELEDVDPFPPPCATQSRIVPLESFPLP